MALSLVRKPAFVLGFSYFIYRSLGCGEQHISVADLGTWLDNGWHWHFPWTTFTDEQCMEEANILRDILTDVSPIQGKEDYWV